MKIKARTGRNVVRFSGRLSRKVVLKPGHYRLTAVATDGSTRSKPVHARFTAARP